MKTASIPQGPWYNADLPDGVYDAEIQYLTRSTYGKEEDMFLQFVLWLPEEEVYFTTNMYFPKGKSNNKSAFRLHRLCKWVGLVPQDALDNPDLFKGAELKIKVKTMKGTGSNKGSTYSDVDLFLPYAFEAISFQHAV